MRAADTTSQSFFEAKYQEAEDPWDFATSTYEQQRYGAIISAISHRRFRHAFEPGCSIGILTEKLASICDRVDATDISPSAIARARSRTQPFTNVHTMCGDLPNLIPPGVFDLILFSEIGYYFTEDDLLSMAETLASRLANSGTFLAAHWLGESSDHVLTGDRVHEVLARILDLKLLPTERHEGFRLDLWVRE